VAALHDLTRSYVRQNSTIRKILSTCQVFAGMSHLELSTYTCGYLALLWSTFHVHTHVIFRKRALHLVALLQRMMVNLYCCDGHLMCTRTKDEGTGSWPDYLVNCDDQKNEGPFGGNNCTEIEKYLWSERSGLWVPRDSWLKAQFRAILEPNTNAQRMSLLSHLLCLLIIGRDWLRLLQPLAQSLIGSPCTLLRTGTGWRRSLGCLIFVGHFPQKSPTLGGSFAKNDLQLTASYDIACVCTKSTGNLNKIVQGMGWLRSVGSFKL